MLTQMQTAVASAERLFALIDEEAEQPDAADALAPESCRGAVDVEDVSFSYTPAVPLIEHFNLRVQPGQRIAIVGPTGCGKTTMINLLMRFYDVDSGRIAVDGNPILALKRDALRGMYGMVLQAVSYTHLSRRTVVCTSRYMYRFSTSEPPCCTALSTAASSCSMVTPSARVTVPRRSMGYWVYSTSSRPVYRHTVVETVTSTMVNRTVSYTHLCIINRLVKTKAWNQ